MIYFEKIKIDMQVMVANMYESIRTAFDQPYNWGGYYALMRIRQKLEDYPKERFIFQMIHNIAPQMNEE